MEFSALHFRKWLALFFIVLLGFATLLGVRCFDRFYVSGSQMLVDATFLHELAHWKKIGQGVGAVKFSDGQVSVVNTELESTIVLQKIPVLTPGYFRLSFEGGGSDIVKGVRPSDRGAVAVIHRDRSNKFLRSNTAMSIYGTKVMQSYQLDMFLDQEVQSVDLAIRLLRSSGELSVRKLIFTDLTEYTAYAWLARGIVVAWGVVIILIILGFFREMRTRSLVIPAVVIGIICIGTLLSGRLMSPVVQAVGGYLPESFFVLLRAVLALFFDIEGFSGRGPEISKLGHIVAFAFLGLFLGWGRLRGELFYPACVIMVLAFSTEVLQTLSLVRTGTAIDFYLDSVFGLSGLVVGAGCCFVLGKLCECYCSSRR